MSNLRLDLQAHLAANRLSVRAAARQMRVSFSALARFVRGQTQTPTPHMDQAIQRLLGGTPLPCPCARCQGKVPCLTLEGRVEKLEKALRHLRRSTRHLEQTLSHQASVLDATHVK